MPDATDEDIAAIMGSDGGRDTLFRDLILAGGINGQVQTTYAKVASKYQDVLALEQSVALLHQMVLDFALLTEHQGESLDHVEFSVKQAEDYTAEGNGNLSKGIEYQRLIRRKHCCLALILSLAVAILLFTLLGFPGT